MTTPERTPAPAHSPTKVYMWGTVLQSIACDFHDPAATASSARARVRVRRTDRDHHDHRLQPDRCSGESSKPGPQDGRREPRHACCTTTMALWSRVVPRGSILHCGRATVDSRRPARPRTLKSHAEPSSNAMLDVALTEPPAAPAVPFLGDWCWS